MKPTTEDLHRLSATALQRALAMSTVQPDIRLSVCEGLGMMMMMMMMMQVNFNDKMIEVPLQKNSSIYELKRTLAEKTGWIVE